MTSSVSRCLGVSVALSEAEVRWRKFLTDLKDRGLDNMQLCVVDDHAGLKAARRAVFPPVPWQRCQFHLQQNAGHYVPRHDLRVQVARDIRAIFNAAEVKRLLDMFVGSYRKEAPKLATGAKDALSELVGSGNPITSVYLPTSAGIVYSRVAKVEIGDRPHRLRDVRR